MKKTLFVLTFAMVLMLAFAAPAFAKYAGFSASTQYVSWAVASSLASQNADAALQAGAHGNYATTTIKCVVCHSVHRGDNKVLTSANACAYCHTNTYYNGGAVSTKLISWTYNSSGSTPNGGPHNSYCMGGCHGSPHGAGVSAYDVMDPKLFPGDADALLVEIATANGLTSTVLAAAAPYSGNNRVVATAALCGKCHEDSAFGIITAGSKYTVAEAGLTTGVTQATGHRVVAAASASWDGTQFNATYVGKIAWAATDYCSSCHDLTDDNNANKKAFPHAINDVVSVSQGKTAGRRAAVWLTAGAYAGAQLFAVGEYNDYSGSSTVASAAGSTILDGVCLKCHRGNAAGASGVGINY